MREPGEVLQRLPFSWYFESAEEFRSCSMPGPEAANPQAHPAQISIRRQIVLYAAAVFLPWLAAYLSMHVQALHATPLALNFAAIVAAAAFFGEKPAIAAVFASALAFQVYLASTMRAGPADTLIRLAVILLAGGLITLMINQRYTALERLQAAMVVLQEQKDILAQAQQASNSAAWSFDARTGQTQWYEGGAEIFGRPHTEIAAVGSPRQYILEEDLEKLDEAAAYTMDTGAPFNAEFRVVWPNGEVHWLEARGTPVVRDRHLWRGATIDITHRKQAETALLRSEKLAVAGRLATSIAHEINNPLEAVTNLCYLAKTCSSMEDAAVYLEMAERELIRMAQFTSQTLRFHRQQSHATELDLVDLVSSVLSTYEDRLAQREIEVQVESERLPALVCYGGEIRQALTTIVTNAFDAMPNGGVLRVRVRPGKDWRTGEGAARITIADNGHGMSPDVQRRIFEPFFTTRGEVGTGLGLWVTAGIIEKHNGSVQVRSSNTCGHSGTVFSLLLPYETGHQAMAVS
jgi:PAS domain S-box-containing protein